MRGECSCLTDGDLIEFGSGGRTMGYIRRDEKDMLLCVFNADNHEIRFKMPKEFIGGKPYLDTVIEEDELVIPRDGCAFVWAETPEIIPLVEETLADETTEADETLTNETPETPEPSNETDIPGLVLSD